MSGFDDTNFLQQLGLAILGYDDAAGGPLTEQRLHSLRHRHDSFAGADDKDSAKVREGITSTRDFDRCPTHVHMALDGIGSVNSLHSDVENSRGIQAQLLN